MAAKIQNCRQGSADLNLWILQSPREMKPLEMVMGPHFLGNCSWKHNFVSWILWKYPVRKIIIPQRQNPQDSRGSISGPLRFFQ